MSQGEEARARSRARSHHMWQGVFYELKQEVTKEHLGSVVVGFVSSVQLPKVYSFSVFLSLSSAQNWTRHHFSSMLVVASSCINCTFVPMMLLCFFFRQIWINMREASSVPLIVRSNKPEGESSPSFSQTRSQESFFFLRLSSYAIVVDHDDEVCVIAAAVGFIIGLPAAAVQTADHVE